MNTCWLCEKKFDGPSYPTLFGLQCKECGEPGPLGPTEDELAEAEDDKREFDDTDYSDDSDTAREVCVPRWGPI